MRSPRLFPSLSGSDAPVETLRRRRYVKSFVLVNGKPHLISRRVDLAGAHRW